MKYFKWIYLLLICSVLLFSEVKYIQTGSKEVGLFLGWIMAVLTMPIGVVFILGVSAVGAVFPLDDWIGSGIFSQSLFLFIFWLGIALLGYWQWFILLPKVLAKIEIRKISRRKYQREQKITKLVE